ncbi:hypothetical protein RQP46_007447 [Phenoliferia psychrophenolica]
MSQDRTRPPFLATSSASAPPPPHPRQLPFPPEVLELIFAEVSHLIIWEADVPGGDELAERNRVLASLALCSSQFQQAVYSTLYGDLRLDWCANGVPKLLRSFEENPRLPLLVRRLEALGRLGVWGGFRDRHVQAQMEDADFQEGWFNSYVRKNKIDEEWEGDNPYEDVWEAELVAAAKVEWAEGCLDGWEGRADVAGFGELVDLLDRTTNLRSVTIFRFGHPLPDFLANRGPFPSILALQLFDEADVVERPATLASLLLSRTPSLQYLDTWHPPTGPLPPLTSLRIRRSHAAARKPNATRLNDLLKLLRPSLRSLDVDVQAIQDGESRDPNVGWAALLAPFISTLERLTLRDGRWGAPSTRPDQVNELASEIAISSLVHLRLQITWIRDLPPPSMAAGTRGVTMGRGAEAFWSPEPLLASLSSTVRSLTLAEESDTPTLELGDRLERMLEALKSTSARPLRVEMQVRKNRRGGWDLKAFKARKERALEFVELYAAEGFTLVV